MPPGFSLLTLACHLHGCRRNTRRTRAAPQEEHNGEQGGAQRATVPLNVLLNSSFLRLVFPELDPLASALVVYGHLPPERRPLEY